MTEETILKKANSKKGLTEEIANFYSLANILPDPDIVLRKQGKDIRIYKELLCDPHVFACIQSRKSGVLSLDWEINRGLDKDKNAVEIEELLKKINIHKLISLPVTFCLQRLLQNLLNGSVLMTIIILNSELKIIITEK